MKKVFSDYLDIYKKFPPNAFLSKEERKERYNMLCEYGKREYNDEISIEEFKTFIEKNQNNISLTPEFIRNIIPILKKDIEDGGTTALKFLTDETEDHLFAHSSIFTNFYNILHSAFAQYGDILQLIELLIQREKDYEPALRTKMKLINRSINFSLHELPWAVLLAKDEAKEDLKRLEEYEALAKRFGKNDENTKEFIESSEFYLKSWIDYLDNRENYEDFKTYLDINGSYKDEFKKN